MVERLRLSTFMPDAARPKKDVEVELRQVERSSSHRGRELRSYRVVVGGVELGRVDAVVENTDRQYNRIRLPGKGRVAWSWESWKGERNYPGLYAPTRRTAVALVLGYDKAEVIR